MRGMGCTFATLETEVTNTTAGKLYITIWALSVTSFWSAII